MSKLDIKSIITIGVALMLGIIFLVIGSTLLPDFMSTSVDAKAAYHTEVDNPVYTHGHSGPGNRTANITLDYDLYLDSLARVITITASNGNVTDGALTAGNWTNAGNVLRVDGLTAAGNRTLTTRYEFDGTTLTTGTGTVIDVLPTMGAVVLLGFGVLLMAGSVVVGYTKMRM